jgi:hypothetical protein
VDQEVTVYEWYVPQRWQVIDIPTPVAGAELDITNPGRGVWLIHSIRARFTASAVVAVRDPLWTLDQAGLEFWRTDNATTIAATASAIFEGFDGSTGAAVTPSASFLPWPDCGLWLRQGDHLRTLTALIDPADQWDQCRLLVEEIPLLPPSAMPHVGVASGELTVLPG